MIRLGCPVSGRSSSRIMRVCSDNSFRTEQEVYEDASKLAKPSWEAITC